MGILNITPDSFSDGGDFVDPKRALQEAQKMIEEGATILDIGAESTAPNAPKITAKEEWKRLNPLLPKLISLCKEKNVLLSVDTQKNEIAEKVLKMGADMINDVSAFGDPHMPEIISKYKTRIILMFSKDGSKYYEKEYENIIEEITEFLTEKIKLAKSHGIPEENIILDPGMGAFLSKDPQKSFLVLKELQTLKKKFPKQKWLIGTSRKSFLREVSHPTDPKERTIASITSSLIAIQNGANIIRIHDTKEMKEAIDTHNAIQESNIGRGGATCPPNEINSTDGVSQRGFQHIEKKLEYDLSLTPHKKKYQNIYLSLGSNLGDRFQHLQNAIKELSKISDIEKVSSIYESKAWGEEDQPDFLNCCIKISTNFEPEEYLKKIKHIEEKLGRIKRDKWKEREIDIDIILWGDERINLPHLKIPHPYWEEREFVKVPLNEIVNKGS